METFAAVVDLKGLLGLVVGILILIGIGNLVLGGDESGRRRGRRHTGGPPADGYGQDWDDVTGDYDEDEQEDEMDVLTATRALIVPDAYEGRHLYVEIDDGSVVHLFGRWLEDYHVGEARATFPCERFRPYADYQDPFDLEHPFRVECLGQPLRPRVATEPLSLEARREGLAPADWDRLRIGFDRLVRRIGRTDSLPLPSRISDPLEALWQAEPAQPLHDAAPAGENGLSTASAASPSAASPSAASPSAASPLAAPDEPLFSTSRDLDTLDPLEPTEAASPPPADSPSLGDAEEVARDPEEG